MGSVVPLKKEINNSYLSLKNLCNDKLEEVSQRIKYKLASEINLIHKMTNYHVKSGGKRIRPLLTLASAKMCGYKNGNGVACGEERSPLKGYYRRGDTHELWCSFEATQMLRTHTGISRTTGTVQQSILFSRSVLTAESCFRGALQIEEPVAVKLKDFIEEANQAGMIRVGSNRSRGMGRVELNLSLLNPDTPEQLLGRLQAFNQRLIQEAAKYNIPLKHGCYVPITLSPDSILVDDLLRYPTFFGADYLAAPHVLDGLGLV